LKFVFLGVALIGVLPLAWWLRDNPRHIQKVWVLVGFLPIGITAIPHLYIAVISWSGWPGFVKGAEISALDFVVFALWIGLPKSRAGIPFKTFMVLYLLTVVVSSFGADTPQATLFYIWQIARMYFIYSVVVRASVEEGVIESILTGMLIGLCYEAWTVLWQRFVLGDVQTPGTLGHQNTLGMFSHVVVFPLFALFLAGKKGWQPIVAPLAGIVIAILTVSRATIGLAGMGYFVLFVLAALRRWTSRLAKIALVAVVSLAAVGPFAVASFERRFALEPISDSYDERAAFESAAKMMLSDHPFGVGANNFVVVANSAGYFDRAGVAPILSSRSAHVHNAYLLSAAETGYVGAIAFALMVAGPLIAAFRFGWRDRRGSNGPLLLGFGVGLLALYLQCLYEWSVFLFYTQYMVTITVGMIGGLVQQIQYRSGASSRSAGSIGAVAVPSNKIWLK
jgi:O-antigen ligase